MFYRWLWNTDMSYIDDSIWDMTQITFLAIAWNKGLAGTSISDRICNLKLATQLGLHHNQLEGGVPDCLGSMPYLKQL